MIKAIVIGVIVSLLTAIGAWAVHVLEERELLKGQLKTAVETNKENDKEIAKLKALNQQKEAQIAQRDILERQNQTQLKKLNQQIRDLKNEPAKITVTERECMESDIPLPVLDVLREHPEGAYKGKGNRQGVPSHPTLLAITDPRLYRFDLGGRSDLHLGVESLYSYPPERP